MQNFMHFPAKGPRLFSDQHLLEAIGAEQVRNDSIGQNNNRHILPYI